MDGINSHKRNNLHFWQRLPLAAAGDRFGLKLTGLAMTISVMVVLSRTPVIPRRPGLWVDAGITLLR